MSGDPISYSLEDAAEATGYSVDVLRYAHAKGDLTWKYANKKPVITRAELEAWVESLPAEPPAKRAAKRAAS